MTEQDTIKAVTLIFMSYPAADKFKDENSIKGMVSVWKTMFKDDDAQLVMASIQKHIAVNKWPPSIAEIREQMVSITRPDIIPPDIAWSMVSDVMSVKGEYCHFDLYRVLPEMIARVVETIGWSKLYDLHRGSVRGNKDGMDRVAFMELYKPAYEREREKAMLPQMLSNEIENRKYVAGGNTLKMIEDIRKQREEKGKRFGYIGAADMPDLLSGSDENAAEME